MSVLKRLIPMMLVFVFEIVIGVLLLIDGERFTQVVFIIFGVFLLIGGLLMLIRSLLQSRNGGAIPMGQLVFSIVLLAIGAFFTAASGSVMSVMSAFTLAIGIIMAFNGMLKLAEFFAIQKQSGTGAAWFAAVGAVITIVLGIVIAFNPFGATGVMWTILGIMIIVSAVLDIISLIVMGVALKNADVTVIEAEVKDID